MISKSTHLISIDGLTDWAWFNVSTNTV